MPRYASDTSVSGEIERTLERYGASQFMSGWDAERALIAFTMCGRQIRFVLPMPDRNDSEFTETPTGKERAEAAAYRAWEQACRQRWRALTLVIKGMSSSSDSGSSSSSSKSPSSRNRHSKLSTHCFEMSFAS